MPILIFYHFLNFALANPTVIEEMRFSNVTLLDFEEQAFTIEDLHRTHVSRKFQKWCLKLLRVSSAMKINVSRNGRVRKMLSASTSVPNTCASAR